MKFSVIPSRFACVCVVAIVSSVSFQAQEATGKHTSRTGEALASQALSRTPPRATVPVAPRQARTMDGWEVEFYGALATSGGARRGAAALPPPGEAFTTAVGSLPSRLVPSWYFGDGAALLNATLDAVQASVASRVVPLDPILTSSAVESSVVGGAGVRFIGHSGRHAAEVSVGLGPALTLSSDVRDRIEQSRASFEQALRALLSDESRFVDPAVSSIAEVGGPAGHTVVLSGAWRMRLGPARRIEPFILAGGGVSIALTDGPEISLTGQYSFRSAPFFGSREFNETDRLTVLMSPPGASLVAFAGGGLTVATGPSTALRFDVRVQTATGGVDTVLDARPARELQSMAGRVFPDASPTVQFSNSSGSFSSLATTLTSFTSLSGSGPARMILVSIGYAKRF